MDNDYRCPDCGNQPRYIAGRNGELIFFCPKCDKEFTVKDEGYGYLPRREMVRHEKYP
jgi:ribosomal protein L37AE/L43A